MIAGEGLLGKIILAISGKAASKLADLVMDRRRRACRALAKLYYASVSLDEITLEFLQFGRTSIESPASRLAGAVRAFSHRLEVPSNAFVDLASELKEALLIIDPVLAESLAIIHGGKGDFLSFISTSVFHQKVDGATKLFIEVANNRVLSTDFDQAYIAAEVAVRNGERYYWPNGVFDYFNDFEALDVSAVSDEAAQAVFDSISDQNRLLKEARESLRSLLLKNFKVEEILFLPK